MKFAILLLLLTSVILVQADYFLNTVEGEAATELTNEGCRAACRSQGHFGGRAEVSGPNGGLLARWYTRGFCRCN
ncbi:unnamed protein product, partial [Plutella xylostella]